MRKQTAIVADRTVSATNEAAAAGLALVLSCPERVMCRSCRERIVRALDVLRRAAPDLPRCVKCGRPWSAKVSTSATEIVCKKCGGCTCPVRPCRVHDPGPWPKDGLDDGVYKPGEAPRKRRIICVESAPQSTRSDGWKGGPPLRGFKDAGE